jgi:hypothetical protein
MLGKTDSKLMISSGPQLLVSPGSSLRPPLSLAAASSENALFSGCHPLRSVPHLVNPHVFDEIDVTDF